MLSKKMSDFTSVVKHLDIVKARKATSDDLHRSGPNFANPDKYLSVVTSRAIKKIPLVLTIPKHVYTYAQIALYGQPRLLFQYNISMTKPFYLINAYPVGGAFVRGGSVCIKYRSGTDVFRYRLGGATGATNQGNNIFFQNYNNQKIGSNFCIEFWLTNAFPLLPSFGIIQDIVLQTSILSNPNTSDDIQISDVITSDALERTDLGNYFPSFVPMQQDNQVWLDN